jgi:hypothetical protein
MFEDGNKTYMIPPTFGKVGQLMLQRKFPNFEHNTQKEAKIDIAEQQHFGPPANSVCNYKFVM